MTTESVTDRTRFRWGLGAAACVGVLLAAGLALYVRRPRPVPELGSCEGTHTIDATKAAAGEGAVTSKPTEEAVFPQRRLVLAPWDATTTWAFRREEGTPVDSIQDGLTQPGQSQDITDSQLGSTRHRAREVITNGEIWSEESILGERTHCALMSGRVMSSPLRVLATAGDGAFMHLTAGSQLIVNPGTPATINGDPGTTYVWSPADGPALQAELTVDERNQLRRAIVKDTVRDRVLTTFSADPTDAKVVDPSDQPIVTAP